MDRSPRPEGREDATFMLRAIQQSFERMTTMMAYMNEKVARQEATLETLQQGVPQGVSNVRG